jgi:enamine deaminase RidA (YjgF/YER057c/UK114 family)
MGSVRGIAPGILKIDVIALEQGKIQYINPENLMKPRGFRLATVTGGSRKTVYLGGQDAVDENGNTVGKGYLKKQAEQIFDNLEKVLHAAGTGLENIVQWNVYLIGGQNPAPGFEAFLKRWGNREHFPVITVIFVAGLARSDWLVEMEGIVGVPGCFPSEYD